MNPRISWIAVFAACLLSGLPSMGQTFSLDASSPSLGAALVPDDILNRFPVGGEATLAGIGEEVDAFSYGKPLDDFLSYFPPLTDVFYSADRSAVGVSGLPVRVEAQLDSAAGDIFRLRLSFGDATVKLVFDGDGTSGPSLGLTEESTADNTDALDMYSVPGEIIYFSVSPAALASYPPGTSAADVFMVTPSAPGYDASPPAVRYASAEVLGLAGGDDIDALVVFEDGDGVFTPGADVVVFSLAPGSPYIGTSDPGPNYPTAAVTEGDLLVDEGVYGFDKPSIYVDAATLGLSALRDGAAADDNLDAVDMIRRSLGASIGPKWLQQADCEYGLNVQAWRNAGADPTHLIVDDWLCDGRPVGSIEWRGSYQGWAAGQSAATPPPDELRPEGFLVSWFADAGAVGPASLLRADYYPLSAFSRFEAGSVTEFAHCVTPLLEGGYEHVFSYEINFADSAWNEVAGRVYWIAIEAVYTNSAFSYPWAWGTTPPQDNWGSPAMMIDGQGKTNVLNWPPPDWAQATNHPYAAEPVNMAFALLTDIWPARCREWRSAPRESGGGAGSWTSVGNPAVEILRADDFQFDGRPVTDIRWWGCYPGWQSDLTGSATNPVAPPADADAPLGFMLRFYEYDKAQGCPGPSAHDVFVDLAECHETFSASHAGDGAGSEHEYVYLVDLLDCGGGGNAWSLTNGWCGWLGVQAVFPAGFTQELHAGWEWLSACGTNDAPSLVSADGGTTWTNDMPGAPIDLGFELGTDRVPSNGPSETTFTGMNHYTSEGAWGGFELLSEGHCGCGRQVLQSRGDLASSSAWTDVESRVIPRPGYTWPVDGTATQRFYRIRRNNL